MKKIYYTFLFVTLFTLSFLFESFLTVITLELYMFVPDRFLIGNKLKNWHMKKMLQIDFANDPEKLQIINKIL